MTAYNVWKIYCETEAAWKQWVLSENASAPTTCPTNTGHTVTVGSVALEKTIASEPERSAANILYTVPHPASLLYEMCDRDILIKTATYDPRAFVQLNGANANGHIIYAATIPGARGNVFTVEHTAGDTGVGFENRALAATLTMGPTWDLLVTFGTDGSGNSVTPTANEVASVIAADSSILMHISGTPQGTGNGDVQVVAKTALTGGVNNSTEDVKISPTTFVKSAWNEVQQVGVYKSDGGSGYIECTDQGDATTNACLSVWRYLAHNPNTGAPTIVEIRDGFMIVDPLLSDSFEHQAYAVAAPNIPGYLGGQVVQFDAYLRFYKGAQLGATSPQAKALDPTGLGGLAAAELRVCVYYPAGTQNDHVLRLVTYRPPGTF